jgi:hypothetical protein
MDPRQQGFLELCVEMTGYSNAFVAQQIHNPTLSSNRPKSLGAIMEKYSKDQDALGKQLGTFGREWKRISRELDEVAVNWENMAEKLLPNYSIAPNQTTGCTQMKGNAAGREFSVYFAPFLLDDKLYGQIVVKADSVLGEAAADAARLLIGPGGAFYEGNGSLLHGEQELAHRYVVLCNIFKNVLAAPF